jgi:hypothetical protein
MSKTINVAGLQRISAEYDPVLRVLPFNELRPRIAAMGFRFLSSDKELRQANFERKGANTLPLVAGLADEDITNATAIGRVKESILTPSWGYTAIEEDIMNYEDVNIVGNDPERVDPITKKHPQELLIISSVVKTTAEDLLDAIYFAERDDDGTSPLDLLDGINHLVDTLIASGDITTGKGNLVSTGAIVAPGSGETEAYDQLVAFLRKANYGLKAGGAILKISETVYFRAMDALANKLQYKGMMAYDMLLNALIGDGNFSGLKLSVEPEMGTGDRIYLTKPDNFDFSLWTDPASAFVQVRNPFKNPNMVQYWSQWKAGARVRNTHCKMFMVNDGTAVGQQLSGDYLS